MAKSKPRVLRLKEIAEALGVSQQTILLRQQVGMPGPPPTEAEFIAAVDDNEQRESDPGECLFRTLQEVADHFGVATRTVSAWIAEGAPDKGIDGRYDAILINIWLRRMGRRL